MGDTYIMLDNVSAEDVSLAIRWLKAILSDITEDDDGHTRVCVIEGLDADDEKQLETLVGVLEKSLGWF